MAPQDSFIDDEEETCPLCIEELDPSDRNFKPCPCGYQICQFCFNNIRNNNVAGLCPACRRPYDDKTIEWKAVSQEEMAQFRVIAAKKEKKKAELRQKETQKREVESANRKHLAGLRVVQKNLVYVVGLSPGIREDEILQTLRGDKYFGQYGKIIKIVVSKAKQTEAAQSGSLGVYVTFARNDDAARCISAVNGSQNGDRILRAQLGTTKYCSAYLRNEICNNKQCMFLHEDGENDDSYSRQDLSSINTVNTQRPLSTSATSSRQAALVQAPVAAQPMSAATQPMDRADSSQDSEGGVDNSALPSTASWANRGLKETFSRRGSLTSGTASSPAPSHAAPVATEVIEPPAAEPAVEENPLVSNPEPTIIAEAPKPKRNPLMMKLMKDINSPFSFAPPTGDEYTDTSSYPPLFDDNGGMKRRAMRKHQEEERLQLEQESQTDLGSIPEPLEEEEPESGSFQLGGEPEDRDTGREGNMPQGFQRRPSSQLPIQRGSSGASFGGNLGQNFPQNLNNLPLINGRALSAAQQQQLLLLKSGQSNFIEQQQQYPPGIGNQGSTLFQQQGHNRQSSRYSFANDSSSATSVKPLANPKTMAQQSSMMPSGNHAQQGQFYGSSMPGPPPGLKSSGTPPIGMFNQSQSFGGAMGGAASFGGIPKESQNEMLREMLRPRANGGQVHETGKREYMFPSFLNQYPSSSSTPSPTPGLLASLYGHQPGVFHDFNQKQKKKGKKHRHANTSSSGGSGLVDVADPSILHARMQQHQQQSNAGVGQVFGGQGQDDLDPSSLDDDVSSSVKDSVEALLAGSFDDDYPSQSQDSFGFNTRPSTPSVPPGFEATHGHPSPAIRDEIIPKAPSKMMATSAEFTPSRIRAATPLSQVSVPPSPVQNFTRLIQGTSASQARTETKALATSSGLSKAIALQSSQSALQSEDFPALESSKLAGKSIDNSTPTPSAAAIKSPLVTNKKIPTGPSATAPSTKPTEKKSIPGILNISITSKPASKPSSSTDTPVVKPVVSPTDFPALKPSIPQPVLSRSAPKTLRIAAPTKVEEAAPLVVTPSSTASNIPPTISTSRQASHAAFRLDGAGTPTSEFFDNASMTSASMSRANSPPPTKVGSAPVRENTKSMQKKTRVQRAKEKAEQEAAAVIATKPLAAPVEIAPVMGRKKKQKKDRVFSSMTAVSTPSASRAPSPAPLERAKEESSKGKNMIEEVNKVAEKSAAVPEIPKPTAIATDYKGKQKAKVQHSPAPEQSPITPTVDDAPAEKPIPTPASILQELIANGAVVSAERLSLLKSPVNSVKYQDGQIDMQSANQKLTITPEDKAALQAGKPVHKVADGPNRIMLTPNGDCVRNLTEDEEQRYLVLQSAIAESAGPTAFVSAKYHTGNGFTLIGGRAVPNGPPPFFPLPSAANVPVMDPVSKIQRDEALSYINQYVLPSLSSNSQLEKALNPNALDKNLLRSSDASNWAQWGNDVPSSHLDNSHPDSTPNQEMLGLESITAHFAIGGNLDRSQPLGNVSMLGVSEAESALQLARKEAEGFEKRFNALLKKNRKLLLGSQH